MARYLIVVPPLAGHTNPTIPVGRELLARGHEVTWTGLEGVVDQLLPPDADFVPNGGALGRARYEQIQEKSLGLRGAAALKFLYDDFIFPMARASIEELDAITDRLEPDLLIVDQQAVGGAVVARRRGLPWATSATTSAELEDPLAALPKVDRWVRDELVRLQTDFGVDEATARAGDLRFSDDLVLAFTTDALVGPAARFPAHYRFVGPSLGARPSTYSFPWSWLRGDRPHVLVSLGTVSPAAGARFFSVVIEALAGQPLQAIVVAPPAMRGEDRSENLLFVERVPQLALLPAIDAVVSHAGHNTVCESLSNSIPLVVAPIRDDQPIVAEQVVRACAGVRVKFGRVRPDELREAVWRALDDPALAAGAAAVGRSFAAAGGHRAAADALEEVLCLAPV